MTFSLIKIYRASGLLLDHFWPKWPKMLGESSLSSFFFFFLTEILNIVWISSLQLFRNPSPKNASQLPRQVILTTPSQNLHLYLSSHYLSGFFDRIITNLLLLILFLFISPSHLPASHCRSTTEVKQRLISCWYDWIWHRMIGGKKTTTKE